MSDKWPSWTEAHPSWNISCVEIIQRSTTHAGVPPWTNFGGGVKKMIREAFWGHKAFVISAMKDISCKPFLYIRLIQTNAIPCDGRNLSLNWFCHFLLQVRCWIMHRIFVLVVKQVQRETYTGLNFTKLSQVHIILHRKHLFDLIRKSSQFRPGIKRLLQQLTSDKFSLAEVTTCILSLQPKFLLLLI